MPLSVTLKDLLIFLFYLMWLVLCCGKNHFQNVEYSGRRSNPNTIQERVASQAERKPERSTTIPIHGKE